MLATLKHGNCFSDKRLSSPFSHMCTRVFVLSPFLGSQLSRYLHLCLQA